MHKLVVRPLKVHLQKLFFDYYTKTGAIRLLADNIQYASGRPNSELGIKPKITLPSETVLNRISHYVQRLQQVDSPLEKLENLLAAIAIIFNSVGLVYTSFSMRFKIENSRSRLVNWQVQEGPYSWGPTIFCQYSFGFWSKPTLLPPKSKRNTCGDFFIPPYFREKVATI